MCGRSVSIGKLRRDRSDHVEALPSELKSLSKIFLGQVDPMQVGRDLGVNAVLTRRISQRSSGLHPPLCLPYCLIGYALLLSRCSRYKGVRTCCQHEHKTGTTICYHERDSIRPAARNLGC